VDDSGLGSTAPAADALPTVPPMPPSTPGAGTGSDPTPPSIPSNPPLTLPEFQGYLRKEGHNRLKTWNRRFFVRCLVDRVCVCVHARVHVGTFARVSRVDAGVSVHA